MRWWTSIVVACAAWLAVPPAQAGDAAAEPPTAADFGARSTFTAPSLSPDGNRIAARTLIDGKPYILLVDVAGAKFEPRRIALANEYELEWFRWAGNDRLILSIGWPDTFLGQEVRVTRLIALDVVSGKLSFIGLKGEGIDGDNVIHIDPEGKFLLLSTQKSIWEYPSVFRVDLATDKVERVVKPQERVWDWYADRAGVVRAGVGSAGTKWWVYYRADATADFERTIRRDARADDDSDVESFVPIAGSDQGYAVATSPSGRFALYRYDFKADRLGETVYENPVVDIDDYDIADDGRIVAVRYTDDRPEIVWLDPELKTLHARIDKTLPGAINRVVSMSRDRTRMLVWSGSAEDPGRYFLYDRTARRMDLVGVSYAALHGKRLAAMEPVRYKARDGLEIRAYLTLPPGRDPKGLPLVMMPHGGPFARDAWGYDAWVQFLATRGYAVLQPNFRGSTGFGRDFVKRGTGGWGRGMQDDIDDGVAWLAARGTIDPKRVCIMGASFGGYAAMWAAARNPEIYRCAISFAGVSDVASMLRYDRKLFAAPRYFRDWREQVKGDGDVTLDAISPLRAVDRMTVPILIAHGSKDGRVPLYQSRRLHEALLAAGRPHDYVVYEGEGHGFDKAENATDFLTRVGRFLDAHNPP